MNDFLISDEAFAIIKAGRKLKKILQREKKLYQLSAHQRCGFGLSVAQFDAIVREAIRSGWCTEKEGPLGGVLLTFVEAFNNVSVPEAVRLTKTELLTEPDGHHEQR